MKRILLLSLLATSGFSQTGEWIYYNKAGDTNSAYRIKPDGTENELIMENAVISDISEDGLKILFDTNGIILLVDTESMDTLTVDNDGINPRFTSDENVIIYYKYMIGNPWGDQLYKYSFLDSSEILIADSCYRFVDNGIMSPDKQKFVFFQYNQGSMDVVIADIQSGQTLTLQSVPNNSDGYTPVHTYWGLDDYIYLNLPDSNNVIQLFRIHSANGDASPIQLTEENENCRLLASNDIHLEKLAFAILDTVRECWLYDFESNETSYLGDINSSSLSAQSAHQTWSPDNSKIAIGKVWATGIWTPGPIKIFDTITDSFTTLVDSTWPPCFWVGDTDEQVSIIDETLPITYNLYNAYPNPFNPVTTLHYNLPEGSYVDIIVYDILGKVVNNLVDGNQSSGYKSVQWNATNNAGQPVSAGLYLYTIQAGDFRQTKKMVLLK
jgi:hypothetical protein